MVATSGHPVVVLVATRCGLGAASVRHSRRPTLWALANRGGGGWCSTCVSLVTPWQRSSRPPLSRPAILPTVTSTLPLRHRTY